jgi:hypothetical protein
MAKAKSPAERLKEVPRKKKVYKKPNGNGVVMTHPTMELVKAKVESGIPLNNNEQGVLNEERVTNYVSDYIAEHKAMPTAANISRELNMAVFTAGKHLQRIIGNDFIKRMAKNLNGHVVAQHFNLIMDKDKATAGLIGSWYDHFGPETEKSNVVANAGNTKITINIVGVEPSKVDAEDAEVIE